MPVQFPMIFSHKHPLTSKSIVDATSTTRSRSSTTITTLEKEFGACEPPKSGFLTKLQIPKRKEPTTQGPEPRRSYEGSWKTMWGCDEEGGSLPQSPFEGVSFLPGSFLDHHDSEEQDSELDQNVATPTNGAGWNSDEEHTPLFSSNFPRTPHPNALIAEGHADGELLGISAPSPIRPDTLQ